MKKWIITIISSAVILGGCGTYEATSDPLPYDNRANNANNVADDGNNENNSDEDEASEEVYLDLTDGVYETVGEGLNGDVVVETTITDGEIANVEIISHDETDGISDEAINDLPNTIVENNSIDVDGASGATYSSDAIKSAVEAAIKEAEGASTQEANLTDGVFETVGEGLNGDVVVETTIENGKIANIEILSHKETEGISDQAINDLPTMIIENNSVNVDGASGATYTSDAIKSAVEAAIKEAGADSTQVANLTDGVFETVGEGLNGDMVVETTIENGKIENIAILSHEETEGISDEAINDLPTTIIENNSVNVDGVSGATYTSDAIKSAVEAAVGEASN